jgi:hypothetical protein
VPATTGTAVYKSALFIVLIASTGLGFAYMDRASPELLPVGYNVYVAPTGSDSNLGSRSDPFRTIQRAASVATPGTIVHVAPGI